MTWASLPIAAIARPRLGGNYPNQPLPTRRPLIKMGNIARIDIDLARVEYIPESATVDDVHMLKFGDVLFNTRNTLDLVGKVSIWRDELPVAYYNSNILRLEFRPEICGDSRYFGYALNSHSIIERIRALATGTTSVAAVYTRDLLRLELPVPNRQEQRAIAEVLNDADQMIARLERLVAKKRLIRQGLKQELLAGRTRLPGYNDVWRLRKWSDVTARRPGNGMIKGRLSAHRTRRAQFQGFSASGPDVWLATYDFEGEGVVVSAVGSRCGKAFLATGRWSAIANTHVVMPVKGQLDVQFAHLYFNDGEFWIKGGSGQPFVQMKASLHRDVLLPPLAEQRAIGVVLADADAEIDALERRIRATRAIKQGMMQELLSGRTRLVREGAA